MLIIKNNTENLLMCMKLNLIYMVQNKTARAISFIIGHLLTL